MSFIVLLLLRLTYFICLQLSTSSSSYHFTLSNQHMCFAKTKSLKLLRERYKLKSEDLGFNVIDSCDYVEYEKAIGNTYSNSSFKILQYNVRRLKSKIDDLELFLKDRISNMCQNLQKLDWNMIFGTMDTNKAFNTLHDKLQLCWTHISLKICPQ